MDDIPRPKEHVNVEVDKVRSINTDLKPLDFPDEIKTKANSIFLKMKCPTKRSKKRKLLVFYCIYCAYLELEIPQVPNAIARKINIPQSEIPKAMALFSEIQTGYRPPEIRITPIHYLRDYCHILGFTPKTTEMVEELTNTILEKDVSLNDESPQKTSAGVLQCFMIMNGIEFNKKEFAKLFGFSEVTINNIYKRILGIYSS
jgi:transcription initiation factor TFIIIB Brf1 subunit/transcription initiation factor TFIIB